MNPFHEKLKKKKGNTIAEFEMQSLVKFAGSALRPPPSTLRPPPSILDPKHQLEWRNPQLVLNMAVDKEGVQFDSIKEARTVQS